ncbi:MAG: zinc ribbon domain-containing protein [Acidobacteria bacterium]|jgi:putative FmdB family regulatory protein|nr:zinc ribbon domain-containing protein [Acidobacteriota bacterium]
MPIYEYKCLGCDALFEKMQKVSDAPLEKCETCDGKLEKQWSRSGFQFKGAGWYVTDYASKKSAAPEKSEKGENYDKGESGEKTSAPESTAKAESASKTTSDSTKNAANSQKEATAKKE